ncbi:MAG: trimethylamine methyltransferase family protein, partial [Candidatus Thorarchaeota archaeon]
MACIKFLSKENIDVIHSASLEVLEKTGVLVKNETALSLLKEAGCSVESNRVRFPSSLVEENIKKPPSSFKLFCREGDFSHEIGGDNVIFNPGSSVTYFRDRDTREIR